MGRAKKTDREDRTAHEQHMRQRIKDAAFKLMAEQGIENVSMRQIAEKVRVTKPVLYYYFKDKEDLCTSIIEEQIRNFDMFLQAALSKKPDAAQLLALVFERHLDFFQKDPRNSKFIARTISYALSNKAKGFIKDGRDQMDRLHHIAQHMAQKEDIPLKGLSDFECLSRAVLLQIMLSAYVQMHLPEVPSVGQERFYDKAAVNRLAHIILLGINEYYKGKKK